MNPPVPAGPLGDVAPGFEFGAMIADEDPADPVASVRIEVREADEEDITIWGGRFPAVAGDLRLANPGQPTLPAKTDLMWRLRSRTAAGRPSRWSPWQPFRIRRSAPVVVAAATGTVTTLDGSVLHAMVTLPPEAQRVDAAEVQLAPRAEPDDPAWDAAIPVGASGATPRGPGGPVAPPAGPPGASVWFEAVDGCKADEGMVVGSTRPRVRIRTAVPIDAIRWRVAQFGHRFEEVSREHPVRVGISDDGRCATFRPKTDLARRGDPRPGWFFPPFPDDGRGRFRGGTYGANITESGLAHHAYAVDFNRGGGNDDRGVPVLAAADGEFAGLGERGTVFIEHPRRGGRYRTQYTHMTDPPQVPLGTPIKRLDPIGRIGSEGARPDGPHLHHAHYKRIGGRYVPIPMKFGGVPVTVSRAARRVPSDIDEWRAPPGLPWIEEPQSEWRKGWRDDPKVTLSVSVHPVAGRWTPFTRIHLTVSRTASAVPPCPDEGCGAPLPPVDVAIEYTGPTLDPGTYSLRYRARDDLGGESQWAYDHSLVVTPP